MSLVTTCPPSTNTSAIFLHITRKHPLSLFSTITTTHFYLLIILDASSSLEFLYVPTFTPFSVPSKSSAKTPSLTFFILTNLPYRATTFSPIISSRIIHRLAARVRIRAPQKSADYSACIIHTASLPAYTCHQFTFSSN